MGRKATLKPQRATERATQRQIGGKHYKDFKIQPIEFITQNKLEDSPNFWSWLALVYFEDLTANLTNISTEGNYIPEMGGYKFSKKN